MWKQQQKRIVMGSFCSTQQLTGINLKIMSMAYNLAEFSSHLLSIPTTYLEKLLFHPSRSLPLQPKK